MKRCFELASKGLGKVAPNPLVGAVIVHENQIIGEGYHTEFGQPHAEVEAIQSVENKNLLATSKLYVNLEPCNHHGKTPPCVDLILQYKIPQVVISNTDPNPLVAGKGIARLRENGVEVTEGILESEGAFLNRRFFTYQEKKRPYIILKWAQTKDGFIDKLRTSDQAEINKISSELSHKLSHQWRGQESAIGVGRNTVVHDNPKLTTRYVVGKNPVRVVIDEDLKLNKGYNVFNNAAPTYIINKNKEEKINNLHYLKIEGEFILENILQKLFELQIQSIIIEGGKNTLEYFIKKDIWDEARVFTAPILFYEGLKSPYFSEKPSQQMTIDNDTLHIYYHP